MARRTRILLTAAGSVLVIALLVVAFVLAAPRVAQVVAPTAGARDFPEQAAFPPLASTPTGPGYVGMIDPDWAKRVANATGIPELAVLAYAGAVVRSAEVTPECGLGWNTLAGIGLIESDHGRHGGSVIRSDFAVQPPIYGPILDGGDTANIPDTDGGALDGNSEYDRAVGPMQIIPRTWASWPSDGNGDGVPDPQNIADAAVAAANYLCNASKGMDTASGWRAGIASYNAGSQYRADVMAAAQRYYDKTR
ncbi:MAG: transglycosylase SLT domain-containing protein [Rhodoglobus sp.]